LGLPHSPVVFHCRQGFQLPLKTLNMSIVIMIIMIITS
jgi:hypothetical protein